VNKVLRQSTASQSRALGPFVDDTDFKTLKTALTIANTDIKLVVNGAASVNKNSGGGTHRVNGVYGITFDATDTATVGELQVSVLVAGALVVFDTYFVVTAAVYDALFGSSAAGYLQPTVAGRTLDVSAGGEAGLDWANIGSPTTAQTLSGTSTKALEPATAGRTLVVDAAGLADATVVKLGPSGAGTAQTARDVGASVIAASVTTGVTLANGAITTAKIAAGAFDPTVFSTTAEQAFADAFLDRDMSSGTDSGSESVRTPRQALRALRNKVDIPNGKVKKEDDTTDSWTFATTTAAGNPVTVVDPT
jgi:hypothetical protein